MKNRIYHTVGIVPKFNKKFMERDKLDTDNKQVDT
jgi:hypothetical protein